MIVAKLNPCRILRDHTRTLTTVEGRELYLPDLLWSYVLPVLIGLATYALDWTPPGSLVGHLLMASALFAPLLLNLLMLIDAQRQAATPDDGTLSSSSMRARLLQDIARNITFTVLVAVMLLFASIGYTAVAEPCCADAGSLRDHVQSLLAALMAMLAINLALTMLMVLKRFHSLVVTG